MTEINNDRLIDGQVVKIISGAIHYFRVIPEYWQDRLIKLKNLGCNTVETYIPWNIHEPYKGEYNFEGINDIEHFIEIATELGLYIILRPSPYICAEWEFGGLPYWLLKESNIKLRTSNNLYMDYVERYFDILIPKLTKYQITNGGNVILFQIENEYGYFGNDKQYLRRLRLNMVKNGVNVPFVTSDGPWGEALDCGNLAKENVLPTLNFGSKAIEHFEHFKKKYPDKPFFCMEFWIGWFDAVGETHHIRDAKECANELRDILSNGHVNIYVFHGGTNFGLLNGANYDEHYMPLVTSYDYDALLTENGIETEKYYEFKKVISEFIPQTRQLQTGPIAIKKYPQIEVLEVYDVLANLPIISRCIKSQYPLTFEALDHPFGYVYYQTELTRKRDIKLQISEGADRAIIYQNNFKKLATLFDQVISNPIEYQMENKSEKLGILVENGGRLNFGHNIDKQHKGITGNVIINNHIHTDFRHYCLDFRNLEQLQPSDHLSDGPTLSHFTLHVDQRADTYVDVAEYGKGLIIVNNEIIGRFSNQGPQTRIYIPGPKLNVGDNQIYIFETEGIRSNTLEFATKQKWSKINMHQAVEN